MHERLTRAGAAFFLTFLSFAALADTKWLPSPAILRVHMCASRFVAVGRLTSVSVEQGPRVRSGSGRIAVEQLVTGAGRPLPAIAWWDRNEVICPRLELDQFQGRLGVWFLHVDSSGAFDRWGSDFWELSTATRVLDEIERSEPLSPELQTLRRAIESSSHAPEN